MEPGAARTTAVREKFVFGEKGTRFEVSLRLLPLSPACSDRIRHAVEINPSVRRSRSGKLILRCHFGG